MCKSFFKTLKAPHYNHSFPPMMIYSMDKINTQVNSKTSTFSTFKTPKINKK
jgi:hypothetical protein